MDKENFSNKPDYEEPIETSSVEPQVGSESYIFEKYGMTREDLAGYLRNNPRVVDFFEDELEQNEEDPFAEELAQIENDSLQGNQGQDDMASLDFGSSRHRQVEGQIGFGQIQEQAEEIQKETSEEQVSYGEGFAMELRERYQIINDIMADLNSLSQDRGFLKKYDSGQTQDLLEHYGPERLEEIRKGKERSSQTTPFRIRDHVLKLLGDIEIVKQVFPEYDEKAYQKELENEINRLYGAGVEDGHKKRQQKLKNTYNPDNPKINKKRS